MGFPRRLQQKATDTRSKKQQKHLQRHFSRAKALETATFPQIKPTWEQSDESKIALASLRLQAISRISFWRSHASSMSKKIRLARPLLCRPPARHFFLPLLFNHLVLFILRRGQFMSEINIVPTVCSYLWSSACTESRIEKMKRECAFLLLLLLLLRLLLLLFSLGDFVTIRSLLNWSVHFSQLEIIRLPWLKTGRRKKVKFIMAWFHTGVLASLRGIKIASPKCTASYCFLTTKATKSV